MKGNMFPDVDVKNLNLLIITSARGKLDGKSALLDKKFVEGMRFYTASWPGRTSCLLRAPRQDALFLGSFNPRSLPFGIEFRSADHHLNADDLEGYDVILASGDNPDYLHVAELGQKLKKSVFFTIEYIPDTRRKITMLDPGRSFLSKMKSLLYITLSEQRRRKAFTIARGLQANGYPAAETYRQINSNIAFYLDNRMAGDMTATEEEMSSRKAHLSSTRPLRLFHAGRLEPLKGSQDLIPIARKLRDRDIPFVLDIFGGGSLEAGIRDDIAKYDLDNRVRLHGVVDFATELVPFARRNSDIFLSCHRQSDPSCSYLEHMGCGLPVAGYDNRMCAALVKDSRAGWTVPLGDWSALADKLTELARNPDDIIEKSTAALNFARAHLFETEFAKRIAQMKAAMPGDHSLQASF